MARKTANRDDGEPGNISNGGGIRDKPLVFSQPSAALHYSAVHHSGVSRHPAQMRLQPRCRLIKDVARPCSGPFAGSTLQTGSRKLNV